MKFLHVLLLLMLVTKFAFSQKDSLYLYDYFDNKPIPNLYYKYGSEQGYSNEKGAIFFTLNNRDSLYIYDIKYKDVISQRDVEYYLKFGGRYAPIYNYVILPSAYSYAHYSNKDIQYVIDENVTHDGGELLKSINDIGSVPTKTS